MSWSFPTTVRKWSGMCANGDVQRLADAHEKNVHWNKRECKGIKVDKRVSEEEM